jgi:DNA-directed RNA polymerase subunit RPC12/RpoP
VGLEFKCSRCGAPLTYTPESIFSVCEYCGYVRWFDEGAKVSIFAVPSKPRDVIIDSFWSRMRMDRDMGRYVDMIIIEDVYGVYVPLYVSDVNVDVEWIGYRIERRKIGRSVTSVRVTRRGGFNADIKHVFHARRHAEEFGLSELCERVKGFNSYVALESLVWGDVKAQVLNAEYSINEALSIIRDDVEDRVRDDIKTRERLHGFYYYSCRVDVRDVKLVLAPLWIITYRFRGGMFKAAFSGFDSSILKVSEPVFLHQRLAYIASSILASIAGSILIIAAASGFLEASLWIPILFLAAALTGAGLAAKSISDVREEER